MKERTLTCIEVETLKEAETYCNENKKRPDVIIISGAAFMGYPHGGNMEYNFFFNGHHLTFLVSSGVFLDEDENFKVHSYNFDKYSGINWIELQ